MFFLSLALTAAVLLVTSLMLPALAAWGLALAGRARDRGPRGAGRA